MTIEDKAQAYDTAIRKAQDIFHTSEFIKITDLFPELAENEDERIRKKIVNFFKNFKETGTWKSISDVNTWIAYLEKQKEQSLRDFIDDFPYSDEQKEQKPLTDEEKEYIRTIKSIISDFIRDKKPENLAYYQRIYDWLDGRHVPFSCSHENGKPADCVFSKQEYDSIISTDTTSVKPAGAAINSEPIPTENHSVDIPLAEWSEDDEIKLASLINYFEGDTLDCSTEDMVRWLKSLRPQPQGIYQQVVKGIRDMCDRYEQNGMFTDERARDFLGNVRVKCKDAIECAPILDEPSWKPNEEQMEALDKARRFIPYNCDALESLYVDLKKL